MVTQLWIAVGLLAIAACAVLFAMWRLTKRRKLGEGDRRKIAEVWILTQKLNDPVRIILEADKIVHQALLLSGYRGSMGDTLKQAGPRFTDQNALWKAHKLRNMVAHEMSYHPGQREINAAMRAFGQALKDLGV